MTETQAVTEPERLSYSDLVGLSLSFNMRVDSLWQRVLYTHAAIVGVMVFFATTSEPYVVTRVLVLLFYSLNTGITIAAFMETYAGLKATFEDLKTYPNVPGNTHLQSWVSERRYHRHAWRRVWLLVVVWLFVAYLMMHRVWVIYTSG